ncbi:MAG: response regulator [Lachnospiraceae bacterium]|nr:response regulator [Lachnospiraceae bacterium]
MDNNRKERMMIMIITVSAIGNIVADIVAGWEAWVIPIVAVGIIGIWWLHLAQKADMFIRTNVYFVYASFFVFFHGIHDISYFDVSVIVLVLMATFMVVDRKSLLNIILAEYVLIMTFQFVNLYLHAQDEVTPVFLIRTVLHYGVVLCMYTLGRILVSSRLTAAKKLDEWHETVRANDHDMEDFLSNISHELRTPVNVISGMTTILQKDDSREELVSIKDACIRLAHQIEDIQDYTEIKRGELYMAEENYMVISLINDVVSIYKANSKMSELELVVDIAPDMPTLLRGDIQKLHKMFRNLLDNAIKFTKRGGVYIRVYSVPHDYGINLTIEVTDTGIGMTRADISRVSRGMYQANKKRNRSTGGIGIGLPIVYGFVHKMGGFVNITSTKGHGTTVRISIPQQVVDFAPCLALKNTANEGIAIYIRPEKFKVPEVREFYNTMAANLAKGLKTALYSISEKRQFDHLIEETKISHLFTGQEEYETDRTYFNEMAKNGYRIIVSAGDGFKPDPGSGVIVIPKPLYAFPVVRILNGESDPEDHQTDGSTTVGFTGVRALVVDDEPMNLVVATGLLKDYGIIVDTADSGKEAVQKYEDGDYDVIFMDHMMPEMDGVEAMKLIRQAALAGRRNPVIIALTANALSGAREMFMKEGFDGFIAKPINIGEFERVMKNVLPDEMIHYEGRAQI